MDMFLYTSKVCKVLVQFPTTLWLLILWGSQSWTRLMNSWVLAAKLLETFTGPGTYLSYWAGITVRSSRNLRANRISIRIWNLISSNSVLLSFWCTSHQFSIIRWLRSLFAMFETCAIVHPTSLSRWHLLRAVSFDILRGSRSVRYMLHIILYTRTYWYYLIIFRQVW